MKFAEHLRQKDLIPEVAVQEALSIQEYKRKPIGRILRDLGYIGQECLNRELTEYLGIAPRTQVTDLEDQVRQNHLSDEHLQSWADNYGVLILKIESKSISCLAKVFKDEVLESSSTLWQKECQLVCISNDAFDFLEASLGRDSSTKSKIVLEKQKTDDERISSTDPYASLFRDALIAAQAQKASDVHIQPTQHGVDIRLRVFGELHTWKTLTNEHRQSFINEVKKLTNLSIGISGRPQDSRVTSDEWKLDMRVSLVPSLYGEKIVLRLLDLGRQFSLESLDFDRHIKTHLKKALDQNTGLILVSGPTGSGKTTTLYTLLSHIDRTLNNILTLEDPVEYRLPGLTQIPVSTRMNFSDALRAVLRQDPDVIFVGEIRDNETAQLCFRAASTGHLVLSTVHANGTHEVIERLLNLGIDKLSIRSNLKFSGAQRLVKKLCPHCSRLLTTPEIDQALLRIKEIGIKPSLSFDFRKRNQEGCDKCYLGVSGRIPLLEFISEREIASYFDQNSNLVLPQSPPLKELCFSKAEDGLVDLQEVFDVA